MPLRSDTRRARDRLQSAAPISDDASLRKLDEEVAECVRETKRRDTRGPDEVASKVVDALARNYFEHTHRKQGRVLRRSR